MVSHLLDIKKPSKEARGIVVSRVLALYTASPGLISGTIYDPLSPTRSDPSVEIGGRQLSGVIQKTKIQEPNKKIKHSKGATNDQRHQETSN